MIDGDLQDFIDHATWGDELYFIYNNKKYFYQGYVKKDGEQHGELFEYFHMDKGYVWSYDGENKNGEAIKNFLQACIFDGKTFLEVEKDIQWVDFFSEDDEERT